ncbi:DUF4128 domain-containing protein [bacterium]|nr:DUF4128 domain-containing protein [bacterium]
MGNISSIQGALDNALIQFGIDNSIKIALNNIDAPTDTSIPFLASNQVNTGVAIADLGTTDVRNGFYQINIAYASHSGDAVINDMADLLNATFKAGANFYHGGVCVSIDACEPTQILINNGWAIMPLTITWASWTARL